MNTEYRTIKPIARINGLELKIIAVITMLIDHIGAIFFPGQMVFRYIGRMAFPIYVFLLVEGLIHTRNIRKYESRLLLFACVSEIPFDMAFNGATLEFSYQNVFFTLALGLIMMDILYHKKKRNAYDLLIVIAFFLGANLLATDYSGGGILLIWWFSEMRNRPAWKYAGLAVISFLFFGTVECWSLLAVIPLLMYNGERGFKRDGALYGGNVQSTASETVKYLFYLFYPIHLLVLAVISQIIY